MNNFEMMRRRLEYQGGIKQEDRMIQDKYKTFLKTLQYSYQAASISLAQHYNDCLSATADLPPDEPIDLAARALINPDKVKQDYDDKILSVDYKYGFQCGDVIKWRETNSYWLIYLEELTEDAYFRAEIRRCKYRIKFKDEEGNWLSTWAAIRGPVETQIDSIQKNQQRIDRPNLSLNILLPRNEKTIAAFERYSEFLFAGRSWKVQAPDTVSITNVIEIAAEESYIDKDTDDTLNEMKNGLIVESDPNEGKNTGIDGPTFIRPILSFTYSVDETNGKWEIMPKSAPITKKESEDSSSIQITWNKMQSGEFTLTWSNGEQTFSKVIVVNW